ncbi:hypothetical protein [Leptolyngbya ohadii]|uniref:hypothetical protein n=1 Tax=Leptolyngbya ohadii TaxID=1962290 RepID=UPI000B5A1811|nr:hypothetical protein [Leptolyngbya ohadii]
MADHHSISSDSQRNHLDDRAATLRSNTPIYRAIDSGITTRRATADEIAFRDGYVQGREQERRRQAHEQRRMQEFYAHQGMVGGLLTGILLTLTVGFITTLLAVNAPQWETELPQPQTNQPLR